jgi:hypothetical protein
MRFGTGLLLGIAVAGCHGDKDDDTGGIGTDDSAADDSGTDDSGGGDDSGTNCTLVVVDTAPGTGAADWLYSDPLTVTFNEPGKAATIALADATGAPVSFTPTWGKGATDVSLAASLAGSTTYTLTVTACGTTTSVDFTTSVYGLPLTIDPSALVGKTYLFDLATAEYSQPPGIGALVALYVSAQVLLGVSAADASTIDLLGAQGEVVAGMMVQDMDINTFVFSGADFTGAPYFAGSAQQIEIVVEDPFTLYDFGVQGTFAPDGASIGGATLSMMLDTTTLAETMNLPDDGPLAACELFEDLGIPCVPCPKGKMLDNCLAIVAHWDEALVVPGLTLKEVAGT